MRALKNLSTICLWGTTIHSQRILIHLVIPQECLRLLTETLSKENPLKRIFDDVYPGEAHVIKELFEKLVFPLYFKKFKNAI